MQSLIITPKNKTALNKLNSFLEEMKDFFIKEEIDEEKKFYPELEKQLIKDREDFKKGKGVKLNTNSFEEFYNNIGNYAQ